jgi:serine protease inhibitor
MSARWISALPDRATTCSAAGAWPLLAILADAAAGPARDELAAAVGVDPSVGTTAGLDVLSWLDDTDGLSGALGVWHRDELPIRPEWEARMPSGVTEKFSGDTVEDQRALDAWARDRTDGLIQRMPVTIDEKTLLLLASALTLQTTWQQKFTAGHRLTRTTGDPSIVRASEDVTCVRVAGDNGIDVHLVLGVEGSPAGAVLRRGMDAIGGAVATVEDPAIAVGPGITVETVPSFGPGPEVSLTVPAFAVRADHDLLERPDVFGLATITDRRRGHLPGISEFPLCVSAAKQTAVAEFSAVGFKAAAVTAIGMRAAAMMRPTRDTIRLSVMLDRPFGFLAVHRDTGLVLFAGWVSEAEFRS